MLNHDEIEIYQKCRQKHFFFATWVGKKEGRNNTLRSACEKNEQKIINRHYNNFKKMDLSKRFFSHKSNKIFF